MLEWKAVRPGSAEPAGQSRPGRGRGTVQTLGRRRAPTEESGARPDTRVGTARRKGCRYASDRRVDGRQPLTINGKVGMPGAGVEGGQAAAPPSREPLSRGSKRTGVRANLSTTQCSD
jgi:hypothetical protein